MQHGIPGDLYSFRPYPEDYAIFVGRICADKRPDRAIEMAKHVGMPLKIAAKVDKVDEQYFESEIKPLLDSPLIEFLGEVNDEEKNALLGGARALLFPIDWPEPFGLVMIESLACGTPLVTTTHGAPQELVRPGVTGELCPPEDPAALAAACLRAFALAREPGTVAACRAAAEPFDWDGGLAPLCERLYRDGR